ncbi:PREDICTED: acyl-CoA Delta(11) desaturase [Polistes dominula]|uniref:Acyl-CoA Delta(11) desaturase n=1 Tax=Polistes dominula TaxID=743375 RepID=A0ABM1HUH1_POLDO|nr:PREDICTED: acyl-CoA Delta(11) desaturase [Polistes dominula]
MSVSAEIDVPKMRTINYGLVLLFIHFHLFAFYGLWLMIFQVQWMTMLFVAFLLLIGYIGITLGAHRYLAHRTFEIENSLKYFFILAHTLAGVGPMYNWVLYHRLHHKFFRTDKDPYLTHKGFMYSYFWSYLLDFPYTEEELKMDIDMRDITVPSISLQKGLYWIYFAVITLLIPIYIPIAYWNENLINSIFVVGFLRLTIMYNVSKMVNSAILVWGLKPNDKFPIEDNTMFFLNKSYWMNYHYFLPWDWKSTEFGPYDKGLTILLIKIFRNMDLLYAPKTISKEDIREVIVKVANKEMSWKDSLILLKKQSDENALKKNLRFKH